MNHAPGVVPNTHTVVETVKLTLTRPMSDYSEDELAIQREVVFHLANRKVPQMLSDRSDFTEEGNRLKGNTKTVRQARKTLAFRENRVEGRVDHSTGRGTISSAKRRKAIRREMMGGRR